MKSDRHKIYTVNNNVTATHNLLSALVETELDAHLVHLGTMGVYGYSTVGAAIPEGYLPVGIETARRRDGRRQEILYPTRPGSIYHMTKSLDQILFQFYAQNDGLRITDLHQGIVWGTHTEQTRRHVQLINRFDYDGDYGTVLNRFLIQAAIGYPLTVHGTGGQTRAFIHIQDSVRCIELALADAPEARRPGEDLQPDDRDPPRPRPRRARRRADRRQDRLAPQPAQGSGRERPRRRRTTSSCALGLDPITLRDGPARPRWSRWRRNTPTASTARRIPCVSAWTKEIAQHRRARPRAPRPEDAPDKPTRPARMQVARPRPTRTSSTPRSTWSPS